MTKRLTYTSGWSGFSFVAIDSNNHLYVVWTDSTHGNYEVYYKRSTNGGTTWTTKRLTWNAGSSYVKDLAVDSNDYIHVVWEDDTPGDSEIYFKKSTDGGASWMTKRLTYNAGYSYDPAVAIDTNDHIHIVWSDGSLGGNYEILYKRSTDGGTTWTTKRLTFNSGPSYLPSIVADSKNHLHVLWGDETPGNWEIYYKKGIQ